MKDYLTKEEILRASGNTNHIELDSVKIQIYPDKMKEVTSVLQAANIKMTLGIPF